MSEIFFTLPAAKNPTLRPSGEKNGAVAPPVPASGTLSSRSMRRRESCVSPVPDSPTETMALPSGATASVGTVHAPARTLGPHGTPNRAGAAGAGVTCLA